MILYILLFFLIYCLKKLNIRQLKHLLKNKIINKATPSKLIFDNLFNEVILLINSLYDLSLNSFIIYLLFLKTNKKFFYD